MPCLRGAVLCRLRAAGDGVHAGGPQVRRVHRPARGGRAAPGESGEGVAAAGAPARASGGAAGHAHRARVRRKPGAAG